MDTNPKIPTAPEKREQLDRILSSKAFETFNKLKELLTKLVTAHLEGKEDEIDQDSLGREIFDRPENWVPLEQTVVRENMRRMRRELDIYYRQEGINDPITIEFPPRSFVPKFSYNAQSSLVREYRGMLAERDRKFFRTTFHHTLGDITALLSVAEKRSYAPAHASVAESYLMYLMCNKTHPKVQVSDAETAVKKALALNDQLWMPHVVTGAIHCCRFEWVKAERAFQTALAIAPEEVRCHLWYQAFLLAIGRTVEAWDAVEFRVRKEPENRRSGLIRALFLYVSRRFDEAVQEIMRYCAEDTHPSIQPDTAILACDNWLGQVLLTCILMRTVYAPIARDVDVVLTNLLMHTIYAPIADKYPYAVERDGTYRGLDCLAASVVGSWSLDREKIRTYTNLMGGSVEPLSKACHEGAKRIMKDMEEDPRGYGPINMALAYMGMGHSEKAIAELAKACDIGHPLMTWLHLWPIFDPLREHEGFEALIKRMNLPTSSLSGVSTASPPASE